MRIIEELLQRVAAFLLTAVWFAIPMGFGLYQANDKPEFVIDDSRLAAFEDRTVVWMDAPTTTSPDPGGDEGEAMDGDDTEPAPQEQTPTPTPTSTPAPASATPVAARPSGAQTSAVGGQGLSTSTRMVRPGYVAGEASTGLKERSARERECDDPTPMVSKVSDDSYRVDRDILELYANDYELLGRLGWVRAHEDERGRRDGFTIRGIRCGTLLQQVGLKNRDTIHSVNGKPVRNLFGALAAYRKFKRDDVVELQITRLGETELITYHMH
jgi:hypothetical protein